ncbi:hypothetical protein [Oceaniglobus roseus]|uniref:hypothetical protein n=1 Tax=Oceaniglobus roseus TaxID=1737570 RepID=UPI000C7F4314|nr:hypothetical protein [Kandeliimicrobium roseum]
MTHRTILSALAVALLVATPGLAAGPDAPGQGRMGETSASDTVRTMEHLQAILRDVRDRVEADDMDAARARMAELTKRLDAAAPGLRAVDEVGFGVIEAAADGASEALNGGSADTTTLRIRLIELGAALGMPLIRDNDPSDPAAPAPAAKDAGPAPDQASAPGGAAVKGEDLVSATVAVPPICTRRRDALLAMADEKGRSRDLRVDALLTEAARLCVAHDIRMAEARFAQVRQLLAD